MKSMQFNSRFEYIDALRGIAVLLVIWMHSTSVYIKLSPVIREKGIWLYKIAHFIDSGRIGVVIFFAISGFVLLKSIKGNTKTGTKTFLIRRFFRLYPAFWVSIILAISLNIIDGNLISYEKVLANITMLPLIFDQNMILGVYWTLEAELFFYILGLFLFIFGISNNPKALFFTSIFLLFLLFLFQMLKITSGNHVGFVVLPLHLSIMFWGAIYRYLLDYPKTKIMFFTTNISLKFLFLFITLALYVVAFIYLIKGIKTDTMAYIQVGLSYSLGISFFLIFTSYIKIKNKFLVFIGKISYSMYLFHAVVFSALNYCLQSYAPQTFKEFHLSVYIITTFFLTIILSTIIYYIIEKPFINYAHHITTYKT